MDPDVFANAQETILPGEQVLWASRPTQDQRPFWNRHVAKIVISFIVLTVIVTLLNPNFLMLAVSAPMAIVTAFTIMFVAMKRRYMGKAAWNLHIITNQRIIHVFIRFGYRQVTSAPLDQSIKIRQISGNQESGDVVFWRPLEANHGRWRTVWEGKLGLQLVSAKYPNYIRDLSKWVIDGNACQPRIREVTPWNGQPLDRTG